MKLHELSLSHNTGSIRRIRQTQLHSHVVLNNSDNDNDNDNDNDSASDNNYCFITTVKSNGISSIH